MAGHHQGAYGGAGQDGVTHAARDLTSALRLIDTSDHARRPELLLALAVRTGGDFRPAFAAPRPGGGGCSCSGGGDGGGGSGAVVKAFGIHAGGADEHEAVFNWMRIARKTVARHARLMGARDTLMTPGAPVADQARACRTLLAEDHVREWIEAARYILAAIRADGTDAANGAQAHMATPEQNYPDQAR